MHSKRCGYDGLSNGDLLFEQEWNRINMSGHCGLNVPEVTDQSQGEEQGEDDQSGSNVMC